MPEYIYPTQADDSHEWVLDMVDAWKATGKRYFCFPFMTFKVHTLPDSGDFWLYMYYRINKTDIKHLKGKIKLRIHVIDWANDPFVRSEVDLHDFDGGETVWLLCDEAQEINEVSGRLLSLSDFEHIDHRTGSPDGKKLSSTIRSSIAPVSCLVGINTVCCWP